MNEKYLSTKTKPISVIIPTYNEEYFLPKLLAHLRTCDGVFEIIVVDAESTDCTTEVTRQFPEIKWIESNRRSRAYQMNLGARRATNSILYFLHADVLPHRAFFDRINSALLTGDLGCFSYEFDVMCWKRRINAAFTQFRNPFIGGGDQSLFIRKSIFKKLDGFDERQVIMEDFEFVRRAKEKYEFLILPEKIVVSARKYNHNSYWKVMYANFVAFSMFKMGIKSKLIKRFYQSTLRSN